MAGRLPSVPWRGTVVMVRDGKVYVNRGTREGATILRPGGGAGSGFFVL